MRELDNIYLLTFNNNKQTKQREDNEHFTKSRHGPFRNFCCIRHCREDQELGLLQEKRREREERRTINITGVAVKKSKTSTVIDGIIVVAETIATILKNSKKLVKILEKLRGPP